MQSFLFTPLVWINLITEPRPSLIDRDVQSVTVLCLHESHLVVFVLFPSSSRGGKVGRHLCPHRAPTNKAFSWVGFPSTTHSLICGIKHLLFSAQATISDLKFRLVEGLRLIEVVSVCGAIHVRMEVLLSLPFGTVPQLAVTLVAASHGVRAFVDLQFGRVFEGHSAIARSPVGLVVGLGAQVASAGRRGEVVLWLMVRSSVEHGAGAVSAAAHFHRLIVLRDQFRIEPTCFIIINRTQ